MEWAQRVVDIYELGSRAACHLDVENAIGGRFATQVIEQSVTDPTWCWDPATLERVRQETYGEIVARVGAVA